MATPSSGSISASQISEELGRASNAAFSLNDADVRKLAGKTSGTISFNDLRGKSFAIEGGELTWSDGTYNYVAFVNPGVEQTFTVNQTINVLYVNIGGGAGGSSSGGGAGAYLTGHKTLTPGTWIASVGVRGNGATQTNAPINSPARMSQRGGKSYFRKSTDRPGQASQSLGGGNAGWAGGPGGCGGGAGEGQHYGPGYQGYPGGGKPPSQPGQGFGSKDTGGGGGGMANRGQTGTSQPRGRGGNGGQGVKSAIAFPDALYSLAGTTKAPSPQGGPQHYVCGGGGGRENNTVGSVGGDGGRGGGGTGNGPLQRGTLHATGFGSGGGGTQQITGGQGSPGVIIFRY